MFTHGGVGYLARKRRNNKKYWIQRAVKRRGALTEWLKRNERKVVGAIKDNIFDKAGNINKSALEKLRRSDFYERLDAKTKRRINLAINLMRLRKKRRR